MATREDGLREAAAEAWRATEIAYAECERARAALATAEQCYEGALDRLGRVEAALACEIKQRRTRA